MRALLRSRSRSRFGIVPRKVARDDGKERGNDAEQGEHSCRKPRDGKSINRCLFKLRSDLALQNDEFWLDRSFGLRWDTLLLVELRNKIDLCVAAVPVGTVGIDLFQTGNNRIARLSR